jgi:hypothetical protein
MIGLLKPFCIPQSKENIIMFGSQKNFLKAVSLFCLGFSVSYAWGFNHLDVNPNLFRIRALKVKFYKTE